MSGDVFSFSDLSKFISSLQSVPFVCMIGGKPTGCLVVNPSNVLYYVIGCDVSSTSMVCTTSPNVPTQNGIWQSNLKTWMETEYADIIKNYSPYDITFYFPDDGITSPMFFINDIQYSFQFDSNIQAYIISLLKSYSGGTPVEVPSPSSVVSTPITTIAQLFSVIAQETNSSKKATTKSSNEKKYIIIGVAVGAGVLLLMGILFVIIYFGSSKTNSPYGGEYPS